MDGVTRRIARRIRRDFPQREITDEVAWTLVDASGSERVQAAILIAAAGDPDEVRRQADLAALDWRDVLVNGGLADADWPRLLRAELGS